jgi:hypothetical protein
MGVATAMVRLPTLRDVIGLDNRPHEKIFTGAAVLGRKIGDLE